MPRKPTKRTHKEPAYQHLRVGATAKREMRRIFEELPGQLSGRRPDPDRIRQRFLAYFTEHLVFKINQGYNAKSQHGARDDLGNAWKRLAPSTVARKLRKMQHVARGIERQLMGSRLTAKQRQAKSLELARTAVPIGIDTGALEKSWRPGRVSGNKYYPNSKFQNVTIDTKGVRISSDHEHAAHFHRVRPIYPRRMSKWTKEAMVVARDQIIRDIKKKLGA